MEFGQGPMVKRKREGNSGVKTTALIALKLYGRFKARR